MRTRPWRDTQPDDVKLNRMFGFYVTQEDADRIIALAASRGQPLSVTIRELVVAGLGEIEE